LAHETKDTTVRCVNQIFQNTKKAKIEEQTRDTKFESKKQKAKSKKQKAKSKKQKASYGESAERRAQANLSSFPTATRKNGGFSCSFRRPFRALHGSSRSQLPVFPRPGQGESHREDGARDSAARRMGGGCTIETRINDRGRDYICPSSCLVCVAEEHEPQSFND
jgi:hypothetical protein